jgi:hypothetical protein
MPINDLRQRYQDSFRIRLGDRSGKLDKNGDPTMVALTDRIRITSPNRAAVEAFAETYGEAKGGEVREWLDEWEVYLPITALPIWIMPGDSLTQWWELWKSKNANVCERRCDGEFEQSTDVKRPCLCPADIDERIADRYSCKPMSRISVVCPDVNILGAGALVTHSRIAAETFPTVIVLANRWLSMNKPVSAVLRTLTHKGRTTFTFPTIEILGPAQGFEDLELDAGAPSPPALEAGRGQAETVHSGPAGPPPFDSSNEKIVARETALALKTEATAGGITGKELADVVAGATGGSVNVLTKVLVEDWALVETAVYAAMERIIERRAAS